ncbi:MAG: T9SS type A sorting domain-containing protein [Saprospiraceae bacterium]|nr:T9SS type A sorting domain-containing protein [Saprospiraceae bacterium]MCF8249096.1 T9SS type A sorting domain-containing protein [Saprospiraceae bacterium]MCF8282901.1 T9SS type A sorting domain-containing protein [Bacteroidales bacterium]MCF8311118.1 T9SS type A sorting domain-containing protein [Saprospiraceae bacterium]MCF8440208.1 T9SS type A sorting domain-containing protein [Saprospiraceae bacterium]
MYDYCGLEDAYCGLQPVSGTRQRLAEWQMELSPNPAADWLTVTLSEGQQSPFSLAIFDFSGKMVFKKNVPTGLSASQVPVSDLPSGMYILTIQQGNAVAARRFAKL